MATTTLLRCNRANTTAAVFALLALTIYIMLLEVRVADASLAQQEQDFWTAFST